MANDRPEYPSEPPYLPPPQAPPTYPPPSPYEPPYVPPAPNQGQPPPPPPGYGTYPPAPPANRGIGTPIKILIGIVLSLMVLVGACTVWFINTVTAPVDKANEFLALIDSRSYDAAVAQTHEGCNQGMTAADIDSVFGGADLVYNLNSSSITNGLATASGSLSLDGVPQSGIEVFLRKIDDNWRVCGFGINAPR